MYWSSVEKQKYREIMHKNLQAISFKTNMKVKYMSKISDRCAAAFSPSYWDVAKELLQSALYSSSAFRCDIRRTMFFWGTLLRDCLKLEAELYDTNNRAN